MMHSLDTVQSNAKKKARPPRNYRHVEIKHTKLGFEAFDFKYSIPLVDPFQTVQLHAFRRIRKHFTQLLL